MTPVSEPKIPNSAPKTISLCLQGPVELPASFLAFLDSETRQPSGPGPKRLYPADLGPFLAGKWRISGSSSPFSSLGRQLRNNYDNFRFLVAVVVLFDDLGAVLADCRFALPLRIRLAAYARALPGLC